jgi:hypothetical protein
MANDGKKPRSMADAIMAVVTAGTAKWTKTVKREERNPASRRYRRLRMTRQRGISQKEAAAQILPAAYAKVSGNGSLPANARQLMYACRAHIQKVTEQELKANYFTQVLLPDYLDETGVDWDVAYDARGHFTEPHDGEYFGLGTLEVRGYLADIHDPAVEDATVSDAEVKTKGPKGSFGAVLFIEKEGFSELLRAAKIAEKYDIAVMSTKGMSVTAARKLADQMCYDHDIPLLILHDFDKAGFSIAGTLQRDTRRYEFQNSITAIDIGLSLADVRAMKLESEYQHHPKGDKAALMANLRENGASSEEIAFMFQDFDRLRSTRRVELNAMTSPQFVKLIENRLRQNGIRKVVPDQDLLAELYCKTEKAARLREAIADGEEGDEDDVNAPPKDLQRRVRTYLKQHPHERWDAAVRALLTKPKKARGGGDRKSTEWVNLESKIARVLGTKAPKSGRARK